MIVYITPQDEIIERLYSKKSFISHLVHSLDILICHSFLLASKVQSDRRLGDLPKGSATQILLAQPRRIAFSNFLQASRVLSQISQTFEVVAELYEGSEAS